MKRAWLIPFPDTASSAAVSIKSVFEGCSDGTSIPSFLFSPTTASFANL
jgi:hypothetical protein